MELRKNELERITLRGFLTHFSVASAIVILLFTVLVFINLTKFDHRLYGLASSVIGGIVLSYYCLFAVSLNRPIHYLLYPVYFGLTCYLFYSFGTSMHSLVF
jgi:TctA family transporter